MRDDSIKPEFPDKVPGDLHLSWGRDSRRDLLERWPATPEGEPVTPAFLTKCGQVDLEDRLLVNMLEAYGIPCLTRYPHSGEFGKVVLGMSGFGTEIYVPETMLQDAIALLESEDVEDELEGEEIR